MVSRACEVCTFSGVSKIKKYGIIITKPFHFCRQCTILIQILICFLFSFSPGPVRGNLAIRHPECTNIEHSILYLGDNLYRIFGHRTTQSMSSCLKIYNNNLYLGYAIIIQTVFKHTVFTNMIVSRVMNNLTIFEFLLTAIIVGGKYFLNNDGILCWDSKTTHNAHWNSMFSGRI